MMYSHNCRLGKSIVPLAYTLTKNANKTCQKLHAIATKKIMCIKKLHMRA